MSNVERFSFYAKYGLPFRYDHDSRMFLVGADEHPISDLPSFFPTDSDSITDEEAEEIFNREHMLYTNYPGPVMLPRMSNWLRSNLDEGVLDQTSAVMGDVYRELRTDIDAGQVAGIDTTRDKNTHWGINVRLMRQEHPHLIFGTIGDCACLGVNVDEAEWSADIASFGFHNIDHDYQRVSLLAGLGHVASLSAMRSAH